MAIPESSDSSKPTANGKSPATAPKSTAVAGHQQQASDDEEKCLLLTPTSLHSCAFAQETIDQDQRAEGDESPPIPPTVLEKDGFTQAAQPSPTPTEATAPPPPHLFLCSPLIYSEPALYSAAFGSGGGHSAVGGLPSCHWAAYSEMALPQRCAEAMEEEGEHGHGHEEEGSQPPGEHLLFRGAKEKSASRAVTPKSSCFFSDSQPSIATGGSVYLPHKQSFSIGEIRDTHMQIQKRYRPSRRRHYTDPVDFEGILNIIGGCGWWQIWVYLLISLQQIPHAMFNLSVVYMMYQPDHWCKVPGMNGSSLENGTSSGLPADGGYLWNVSDALQGSVVYPRTRNKQRDKLNFHSQCHYYDRGEQRYEQLRRMPLDEAQRLVNESGESADIVKCSEWHYDQDVMLSTIVTEWNLVCDDNFKRAHAHLFYSFGFLIGCLLGGFASDRFGRKPTVIGFGILSSLFGLLLPYSTYFPMFLFIRFCGAVCNEAADLAAYVLCMEITGTRYRAMVGSLLQAPWAVGYATLALIAYFCKSWQNIQLITAALHTLSIFLICVLPESPRWLIVNNRVDEAERYIRRACRDPPFPFNLFNFIKSSLPSDLELVKHAEQRKWVRRDQRANILHLLKSRALCVRTGFICVVWIATALVYYGLVIALSDHSAPGRVLFSGNFFLNNAIAGAIELPTLFFCVYLMKYGRKRSQIFTLVGAALFIFLAMGAMSLTSPMSALGLMLLGKIFIQGGFNILYIFTSELYPTVIRNSAVGFCSMIARFGSGVSSYIAILSDVTLAIVPMIIFATFSLFAGTLVMFLPETRDQPLPDTLQDAVTILKDDSRAYQCRGFGSKFLIGKYSISATELVQQQQQNGEEREESECCFAGEGTSSCGREEEEEDEKDVDEDDNDEERSVGTGDRTPRKRSDTHNGGSNGDPVLPSIPEEELPRRSSSDETTTGTGTGSTTAGSGGLARQSPPLLFVAEVDDREREDEGEGLPVRMRHRAGGTKDATWKVSQQELELTAASSQSQSDFSLLTAGGREGSEGGAGGNSSTGQLVPAH